MGHEHFSQFQDIMGPKQYIDQTLNDWLKTLSDIWRVKKMLFSCQQWNNMIVCFSKPEYSTWLLGSLDLSEGNNTSHLTYKVH